MSQYLKKANLKINLIQFVGLNEPTDSKLNWKQFKSIFSSFGPRRIPNQIKSDFGTGLYLSKLS